MKHNKLEKEEWKETREILDDPVMMAGIRAGLKDVREGKTKSWQEAKREIKRSLNKPDRR